MQKYHCHIKRIDFIAIGYLLAIPPKKVTEVACVEQGSIQIQLTIHYNYPNLSFFRYVEQNLEIEVPNQKKVLGL